MPRAAGDQGARRRDDAGRTPPTARKRWSGPKRPKGKQPGARTGPVGYGPNLQAFAVYLMVAQHVLVGRCVQLREVIRANVVPRRNTRGGRSAVEHLIAALRCLYQHAVADGLISEADDPAHRVAKPRRLPTTRRALPDARLAEINEVAATTGNDPALDALLLRLHTESACRRGGALAPRVGDLDVDQCLIQLHEKGDTVRWQPVSPTLMRHLIAHHEERSDGRPGGELLRFRNGRPVTRRRYDYLWDRLGKHLPWVAAQQVSTHWLRHTTLTWVERNFGCAVARAYAGHTGTTDGGATSTYIRADLQEIAVALATLTGEDHPLPRPALTFLA